MYWKASRGGVSFIQPSSPFTTFKSFCLVSWTYRIFIVYLINIRNTRWTFFRVKLVFECDFEISWSLGPWDPWTFGLLDLFLLSTPPLSSSFTSSYLFLLLSSFGIVWYGGRYCWVLTLEIEIGDGPFILMLKSLGVGGWWVGGVGL